MLFKKRRVAKLQWLSGTVDSGTVDSDTVDSGTVDSGTVDRAMCFWKVAFLTKTNCIQLKKTSHVGNYKYRIGAGDGIQPCRHLKGI